MTSLHLLWDGLEGDLTFPDYDVQSLQSPGALLAEGRGHSGAMSVAQTGQTGQKESHDQSCCRQPRSIIRGPIEGLLL
jgi:hypothetical protein